MALDIRPPKPPKGMAKKDTEPKKAKKKSFFSFSRNKPKELQSAKEEKPLPKNLAKAEAELDIRQMEITKSRKELEKDMHHVKGIDIKAKLYAESHSRFICSINP